MNKARPAVTKTPTIKQVSLIQYGEPVADPPGAVYVVRHHKDRHSFFALLTQQQLVDFRRGYSIEAAAGLVGQKHLRFEHERPCEPRSLSHSARQVGGQLALVAFQFNLPEHVVNCEIDFRGALCGEPGQGKRKILV